MSAPLTTDLQASAPGVAPGPARHGAPRSRSPRAPFLRGLLAALALVACGRGAPSPGERAPVRVAAAADLTAAFEELGGEFERRTGQRVAFTFGSSGLLAKQLREGAPFDLFAAASASYVDEAVTAGACDGASQATYARGRLALWTRRGGVAPPASLADLADTRFRRVAIANPEHAPYGQAARQALEQAGLWAAVAPRLVLAENVRQALQFAETGNADAALVALALVARDRDDPWLLVDEALHRPLEQALVVCANGGNREGADAFAGFVRSEAGRAGLLRHGFQLPGGAPAGTP